MRCTNGDVLHEWFVVFRWRVVIDCYVRVYAETREDNGMRGQNGVVQGR